MGFDFSLSLCGFSVTSVIKERFITSEDTEEDITK